MLNAWIDNKRINVPVYLILNDVNMNSRTYSYRQYGSGKYGYGYASSRSEYVIPWYKRLFRKVIVNRNDFEYKRTGKNKILSRSFIGFVESSS